MSPDVRVPGAGCRFQRPDSGFRMTFPIWNPESGHWSSGISPFPQTHLHHPHATHAAHSTHAAHATHARAMVVVVAGAGGLLLLLLDDDGLGRQEQPGDAGAVLE